MGGRGGPGHARLAIALTLSAFGSSAGWADEWAVEPAVSARLFHTDNVDLTPGDGTSASGLALTLSTYLAERSETRELAGDISVTDVRHAARPLLDRVDATVALSLKQSTELGQWSVSLRAVRDSTLNSELATTGIPQVRRQRTSTSLGANWEQALDETTSVNGSVNLNQVRYEAGPGLTDYDDASLSLGLNRALSERLTAGVGMSGERYRTLNGLVRSDSRSLFLTARYAMSERLSVSLQAGRQRTNTTEEVNFASCSLGSPLFCLIFRGRPFDTITTVPVHLVNSGATFSGSADYAFSAGSLHLLAAQTLNSTANSAQARTRSFSAAYSHRFSEALSGSVDASSVESRFLANAGSGSHTRRYSAGLQWRLDEQTELGCSVARTAQRSIAGDSAARANEIWFSFGHSFNPLSTGF